MAYPDSCFTPLIGIRGICEPPAKPPYYWLDDIQGIELSHLAAMASGDNGGTGAKFGQRIIEAATRYLIANIEGIYDSGYKVASSLVSGKSLCSFTAGYSSGSELGVSVENLTGSELARLAIPQLVVRLNSTGTFNVVLNDGTGNNFLMETDFVAGQDVEFKNIPYETKQSKVRIYIAEPGVQLARLSCPGSGSNCGCSGRRAVVEGLAYKGSASGADTQAAYGFLPTALLRCDSSDVLCMLAMEAPRMIGLALLYKSAEQYFMAHPHTMRMNQVAGMMPEVQAGEAGKYGKLYLDLLNGNKVQGLTDLVRHKLQQSPDECIVCDTKWSTAWATG